MFETMPTRSSSPSAGGRRRPRFGLPGLLLAVILGMSACGSDEDATEYSDENREAFLAACTTPGEDQRMIRDVCECTYEQIEANMAFAEFVRMEESLAVDALAPLPDSVAAFMAECFVEEVDL